MSHSFSKITILGPGLLGGSIALASRSSGLNATLWGRNPAQVDAARALGLFATDDLCAALAGADLVILAIPVGGMSALVEQALSYLEKHALVTDVGSVKALPHLIASRHGIRFIGSHPMAGSEQSGLAAAKKDLFHQAPCVLTNAHQVGEAYGVALERFWTTLGCRLHHMTVEEHDRAVARISHLPHTMAALTAYVSLHHLGDSALAAGGFRDTTRVATADPAMWAEIMTENRAALSEALIEVQNEIREMLDQLAHSDQESLCQFLTEAKRRKEEAARFRP